MMKLRWSVFTPPFLMVAFALGLNFWNQTAFLRAVNGTNDWMLSHLSGGFAWVGICAVFLSFILYLAPVGAGRIGGVDAKPMLPFWSWALVSVFAHIGAGILFWSVAEPVYHFSRPPVSLGFNANSPESAVFALSTLFLHWTYTPIAILSLPGLIFAISFYNMKLPFSLSSCLSPLLGKRGSSWFRIPVDTLSLYALVLGMAASLATGVLTIAGGVEHLTHFVSGPKSWTVIALVIGIAFITAAVSGIKRGIKFLSHANSYVFVFFALYLIVVGFPQSAFALSFKALQQYIVEFFPNHLFSRYSASDPWPKQWTIFYWAVWLAWTPITSGFLGRISVGYTVRQYLLVNLAMPSLFSLFWTGLVGGTTLHLEALNAVGLTTMLGAKGPESLAYGVLSYFPFSNIVIPVFLVLIFSAYVTSAASNVTAMAGLSCEGISPENPEPPSWIRMVWGATVMLLSIIMLNLSGIEGIKSLSYLGGVPALFFEFAALLSLCVLVVKPKKFGIDLSPSSTVVADESPKKIALELESTT